ncbi:hypothetical protein [Actinocorallia longicatena]|uniref:hypothetical protein n=1 Tax=Actinocorallia longicatena TaxID=111803 RepID=UPI0031E3AF3C
MTDGGANVVAVTEQLKTEGVPYKLVNLADAARPTITTAFLQDTVSGAPRAKYQAVVLPNTNPFGTGSAEMAAIVAFEKQFGIRQLSSYIYPTPEAGLNYPTYAGQLDGITGTLTPSAKAGAFRYLKGDVAFEDNDPNAPNESYGYLSTPLPDVPAAGTTPATHFEPYLTKDGGVLAGAYTHDGRTEMVMTFAANHFQSQFRLIGHGLITWLTKGVHLGYNRQYFSVHVDDLFLPDARWSTTANCTPGEGCTDPNVTTPDIRMTADDVTAAANWSTQNDFTFDMYFNGFGSDEAVEQNGSDPLLTAVQANKAKFRFANHTFQHTYLGCQQDVTVIPWVCKKDANNNTLWETRPYIRNEITDNRNWGNAKGFGQDTTELVTGEHSGLKILPQQPQDNPNLGLAVNDTGTKWLGSDASRDFDQRAVNNALTVPRYPMANYFNTATVAEMVDEYNWIYTSRADGGSGICEDNPLTVTCIQPLDPATGYQNHIVPLDARIEMSHIIKNDPRPHYVHQSNMAEDRILYPLLDRVLGDYRSVFAENSPLVNQRMAANGAELKRQASWKTTQGAVTAYLQDGRVTISGGGASVHVPITLPAGTDQIVLNLLGLITMTSPFGTSYAGEVSDYKTGNLTFQVGAQTV